MAVIAGQIVPHRLQEHDQGHADGCQGVHRFPEHDGRSIAQQQVPHDTASDSRRQAQDRDAEYIHPFPDGQHRAGYRKGDRTDQFQRQNHQFRHRDSPFYPYL